MQTTRNGCFPCLSRLHWHSGCLVAYADYTASLGYVKLYDSMHTNYVLLVLTGGRGSEKMDFYGVSTGMIWGLYK